MQPKNRLRRDRFPDQSELDRASGWGLRRVAGGKD